MNTSYKQLTRSTTNRMIAGICAGMGEYANIDPTIVRLIAVLLIFLGVWFLVQNLLHIDLGQFWPVILIISGLALLIPAMRKPQP